MSKAAKTAPSEPVEEDNSCISQFFLVEGSDNWWNSHALPDFMKDVWHSLQKCGVKYSSGRYITYDGQWFESELDMRIHLCKNSHKLGNVDALTDKERKTVIRHVSLAHLPKKLENAISIAKALFISCPILMGG